MTNETKSCQMYSNGSLIRYEEGKYCIVFEIEENLIGITPEGRIIYHIEELKQHQFITPTFYCDHYFKSVEEIRNAYDKQRFNRVFSTIEE